MRDIIAFPESSVSEQGQENEMTVHIAKREILAVLRAEAVAFFRRDFYEFARYWVHGPEVRRTISGPICGTRIFVGWEEMSAKIREGMRRFPQSFEFDEWLRLDNLEIHAGTDMAWVSYNQKAVKPNVDIQAAILQHETKILHRINGAWKLVCISIAVPGVERINTPQIELNNDGKVFHINLLAASRLRDHPGLTISRDCLRARQRQFDSGLQNAIKSVLELLNATIPPSFFQQRTVQVVPLGEDDFGHPIYCWVLLEQERLLVSFDDSYQMETRLQLAGDVYRLSPAQRRLAKSLAVGVDLVSAAKDLGVSVNTLRTQLKRMFEKTGTHNQTALISALLSVQSPA